MCAPYESEMYTGWAMAEEAMHINFRNQILGEEEKAPGGERTEGFHGGAQ